MLQVLRQTTDELDHAVDQAIANANAGGDLRLAICNLARRQHEFTAVTSSVSAGYVRRGLRR